MQLALIGYSVRGRTRRAATGCRELYAVESTWVNLHIFPNIILRKAEEVIPPGVVLPPPR